MMFSAQCPGGNNKGCTSVRKAWLREKTHSTATVRKTCKDSTFFWYVSRSVNAARKTGLSFIHYSRLITVKTFYNDPADVRCFWCSPHPSPATTRFGPCPSIRWVGFIPVASFWKDLQVYLLQDLDWGQGLCQSLLSEQSHITIKSNGLKYLILHLLLLSESPWFN